MVAVSKVWYYKYGNYLLTVVMKWKRTGRERIAPKFCCLCFPLSLSARGEFSREGTAAGLPACLLLWFQRSGCCSDTTPGGSGWRT